MGCSALQSGPCIVIVRLAATKANEEAQARQARFYEQFAEF
jgi:hypothetical protein